MDNDDMWIHRPPWAPLGAGMEPRVQLDAWADQISGAIDEGVDPDDWLCVIRLLRHGLQALEVIDDLRRQLASMADQRGDADGQ